MLKRWMWIPAFAVLTATPLPEQQAASRPSETQADRSAVKAPASYAEALEEAKKERRYLVVYFREDNCETCTRFEEDILPSEALSNWLSRFAVLAKLNASTVAIRQFAESHQVKQYPTLLFLASGGEELGRVEGYQVYERPLTLAAAAIGGNRISADRRFSSWLGEDVVLGTIERAGRASLRGDNEEALVLYTWCFEHQVSQHSPNFSRLYFHDLIIRLARFGDNYPPARKYLEDLILLAENRTFANRELRAYWFNIIKFGYMALGREDRIVAHYDLLKRHYPESSSVLSFGKIIYEALLNAQRYEDLAWSVQDQEVIPQIIREMQGGLHTPSEARRIIVARYEILLGISRESQARSVAQEWLAVDKSPASYLALADAGYRSGANIPDVEQHAHRAHIGYAGKNPRAVMVLARIMARDEQRRQQASQMVLKAITDTKSPERREELGACLREIQSQSPSPAKDPSPSSKKTNR